jgi:hypothetical protein
VTEQQAVEFIQRFLQLMEARDLDTANTMILPSASIVFPGGKVFTSQAEMVTASKGRYKWVKKTFDKIDALLLSEDEVVVYVMGTLYGENRHDVEFSGIRYIDRFVIQDGLIVSQEVWNDLAESGVLAAK